MGRLLFFAANFIYYRFNTGFALMTGELAKMLTDLIAALGGE